MNKSLAALVLGIAGCHDYELQKVPKDTGMVPDDATSNSTENLESYDPCDPYDAGWDIAPQGTERAACFGIENGILQYDSSRDLFITNVYLGDCEGFEGGIGFIGFDMDYYSQEEGYAHYGASAGFGSSTSAQCGYTDFASFTIRPYFSSEYAEYLSDALLAYKVWVSSKEEEEQGMTRNELEELTEPLQGIIDCRDAAALADCTIILYH